MAPDSSDNSYYDFLNKVGNRAFGFEDHCSVAGGFPPDVVASINPVYAVDPTGIIKEAGNILYQLTGISPQLQAAAKPGSNFSFNPTNGIS